MGCSGSGLTVVQLPSQPELHPSFLSEHWAFDLPHSASHNQTQEDAQRTSLYRELAERKKYAQSQTTSSMDAFVASLNLRTEFEPLGDLNVERAAQLTDRTNQHNACKWALTPPRLRMCARVCECITAEASDRFGNHGLIGLIAIEPKLHPRHRGLPLEFDARKIEEIFEGDCQHKLTHLFQATQTSPGQERVDGEDCGGALHVRSWLLSCRSLHIGIEFMMLRHLAGLAQARGAGWLAVHWRRSERNEPGGVSIE
ncbi:MAG: hypothetical protein SGPRY_011234 [Prymnesium sp.]